jgi:multidrug efflux pump subunit AcrA (membrane-fusion protein)
MLKPAGPHHLDSSAGSVSKVARDEVEARRVAAAGELEAAEHALADARVQLDQTIDDYENRRLIVPFDRATVAVKNIEPGERKAAHEVAFRLIDISTVYVNFGVPDTMSGAGDRTSPVGASPGWAGGAATPRPRHRGYGHQDRAGGGRRRAPS